MIPKIIHQTWKTKTIPERWKDSVDSCKQLHPDFQLFIILCCVIKIN
jgi:mannosyltransferase OCH1-like enzyme